MAYNGQSYPGQIETDPEITRLFGVLIARWSLAEFSLMMAFLVALDTRRQEVATTILASTNSAEAKIKIVLKTLNAAVIDENRRIEIRKAVNSFERLCPERNALMHHLWARRDSGEIITIDFREQDAEKKQTVRTAEALKAFCNAVVDVALGICVATGASWIDAEAARQLKV